MKILGLSFLLEVFPSQPRDSRKKKGKEVVLHFDPSLCVPYLDYKERKC